MQHALFFNASLPGAIMTCGKCNAVITIIVKRVVVMRRQRQEINCGVAAPKFARGVQSGGVSHLNVVVARAGAKFWRSLRRVKGRRTRTAVVGR